MRGFSVYLAAGILVVLAMDFVAPPVGLGIKVSAWPVAEPGTTIQAVDRTRKGDRLPTATAPVTGDKMRPAENPRELLVGCDPAFNPISAGAFKSLAARCIATLMGHAAAG